MIIDHQDLDHLGVGTRGSWASRRTSDAAVRSRVAGGQGQRRPESPGHPAAQRVGGQPGAGQQRSRAVQQVTSEGHPLLDQG